MIDTSARPIIMDFGLALRASTMDDLRLTLAGVAPGTPAYMPPEQAGGDSGAVGPSSDVYALEVILYELVTGKVPFRDRTFGNLLAKIMRDPRQGGGPATGLPVLDVSRGGGPST